MKIEITCFQSCCWRLVEDGFIWKHGNLNLQVVRGMIKEPSRQISNNNSAIQNNEGNSHQKTLAEDS